MQPRGLIPTEGVGEAEAVTAVRFVAGSLLTGIKASLGIKKLDLQVTSQRRDGDILCGN